MTALHPQYIVNETGQKISVVLSVKEYQNLLKKLGDLEDVRLYDEAKGGNPEFIDATQVFEELYKARLPK